MLVIWPAAARCRNCGARVRLAIPRWQNIMYQLLAQLAFWALLLLGLMDGWPGVLIGGLAGAIIALAIAMIPGFYAGLEVIATQDE